MGVSPVDRPRLVPHERHPDVLDHARLHKSRRERVTKIMEPVAERTRLGGQHFEREAANWERISTAISGVMRLTEV